MVQSAPDKIFSFDILDPAMVALHKRQGLKMVARAMAAQIGINEKILSDRLCDQEKTSPCDMGRGIAIKHMAMDGLLRPISMLVRFKTPVPMDAPDQMGIEFMAIFLTPQRDGSSYLQPLSRLSRFLRDEMVLQKLRGARDEKTLRAVFDTPTPKKLAA